MDLSDIKRAAEAEREFSHTVDGITFSLRLPTAHEVRCVASDSGATRGGVVRAQRATTELAIIGWTGAKVAHILPNHKHGEDELAFEDGATAVLLDARQDIADALWEPLLERLDAQRRTTEATAKNSPRASAGAKASAMRASSPAAA
jgi:hypothetical protein